MKKPKPTTAFLIIGLLILLSISKVASQEIPPVPMTIRGYVFIHTVEGKNVTAPAGLEILAKVGTEIIQLVEGSQNVTDEYGYYCIGISGPDEGTPIDLWVENVNVTRITLQYYTTLELNLTVMDVEAPVIDNLYPEPQSSIQANQPTWINATITDNLAVNASTIKMTLNETELTPTYDLGTGLLYYKTDPLTEGLYIVSLTAEDLAGNVATETWNFTASAEITPPTIEIISPTTENPIYTQSGRTIQITVKYTEQNPLNLTIRINMILKTFTDIPSGTDVTQTFNLEIPATASEGKYSLNVTLYNIYDLSSTDTEENAVIIDNTSPTITDVAQLPAENVQPTDDVKVNVTITDNLSPIKNATLLYSTDNGTTWNEIPMTRLTGNIYTATIPKQGYCTHVTYKIEAYDEADNKQVEDNAGQYYVYHVVPEFHIAAILMLMLITTLMAAALRKAAFKNKS